MIPNIPVRRNRNGPFHLNSNRNFRNLWHNGKHPQVPLFPEIFQWNKPKNHVPFTTQPEFPESLSKWKTPRVTLPRPILLASTFSYDTPPTSEPARRLQIQWQSCVNKPTCKPVYITARKKKIKMLLAGLGSVRHRKKLSDLGLKNAALAAAFSRPRSQFFGYTDLPAAQ